MSTPTGKFWRALRWCAYNGSACVLAYLAFVEKRAWADNVFAFVTVVFASLSFYALCAKDTRRELAARGRMVPACVSISTDMALMLGCAAAGRFFLALCWLVMCGAEQAIFEEEKS